MTTPYDITFNEDQRLILDKLVKDKETAEKNAEKLQNEVQNLSALNEQLKEDNAELRRQLLTVTGDNEEAIRKSELERLAIWLENGGHDEEDIYQMTSAGAAYHICKWLPDVIRSGEHNLTYAESRKQSDPEWPDAYMKKAEDYDFDVNTRVWERT